MQSNVISEPIEFPIHVTGEPAKITVYKETSGEKNRYIVTYYDAACSFGLGDPGIRGSMQNPQRMQLGGSR